MIELLMDMARQGSRPRQWLQLTLLMTLGMVVACATASGLVLVSGMAVMWLGVPEPFAVVFGMVCTVAAITAAVIVLVLDDA